MTEEGGREPYPRGYVTVAHYRCHGDSAAEPLEVVVEADTYDDAIADARVQVAEGDDLVSVQAFIP